MNIGSVVKLSTYEQELARIIASARYDFDTRLGLDPKLHSGKDPLTVGRDAYGAELAFCRMVNCYPDFGTNNFRFCDMVWDGKTVDVKYNPAPDADLKVKSKARDIYPDIYVLMTGIFPVYTYRGCIPKDEIIMPDKVRLVKKGAPSMFVAYQYELR